MDVNDTAPKNIEKPVPERTETLIVSEPVEASDEREAEVIQLQPGSLALSLISKLRMLLQKNAPPYPRRSFIGMFADEGVHITEEDIAEARREMCEKREEK